MAGAEDKETPLVPRYRKIQLKTDEMPVRTNITYRIAAAKDLVFDDQVIKAGDVIEDGISILNAVGIIRRKSYPFNRGGRGWAYLIVPAQIKLIEVQHFTEERELTDEEYKAI